ncbi:flagellar basal body P-ring formation protein FlgA [Sagittula sp. NFXS13]|uniref:flagellar basal body P-ring formation chaperone FlgA n=1 Tax=Sagittula sp. NFXS13 TaxID=2819095 RepID=UPI0032E02DCD
MRLPLAFFLCFCSAAQAETVVATRTIRAQQIISADAVRLDPAQVPGAYDSLEKVIGLEALYAVYPGRALMVGTVAEPAVIDRNQVVEIIYNQGGLRIATEGRALGRGAVGDRIRVMNVSSRTTLFGTIAEDGTVLVAQ